MSRWDDCRPPGARVPKLVPLFHPVPQLAERECGHHGPLPDATRLVCMCCLETGSIYERRLDADLRQTIQAEQAAHDARERRRKAEREALRARRLRKGLKKAGHAAALGG